MFHHEGVLPHLLRPGAYCEEHAFEAEMKALFRPAWQLACLTRDLRRPGDQVVRELGGVPIVLRNEAGELRGFVNICAHRHCLVAPPECRRAEKLSCMYHGWEYGPDGGLARLPDGRSFKGIDAKSISLRRLGLEIVGPLVFANLDPSAPLFVSSLGALGAEVTRFFGDHRPSRVWSTEHDVNWKVIAENAVESYHVPVVHAATFGEFRPPELHEHTLHARYTRYLDKKPWENDLTGLSARVLLRLLVPSPTMQRFTQAHVFPGLLLYYGELVSTLIALEPLGPSRTRHVAITFVPRTVRGGAWMRPLQWAFGKLFSRLGERVLREDMRLWPAVQRGMTHSHHEGALSCREERVFAFQRWVAERVEISRALV
jgi:choline monooxygenase